MQEEHTLLSSMVTAMDTGADFADGLAAGLLSSSSLLPLALTVGPEQVEEVYNR